jgi:CBS domain-containing protein
MNATTLSPRIDQLPLRQLVTIEPEASIRAAARLMRSQEVSALVVGTPGQLVSIVTERDITCAMAEDVDPADPVANIASPDPAVIDVGATVVTAAATMVRRGVRHLVVVDGARAVGMVSIRDAVGALLQAVTPDALFILLRTREPDAPELWLG